MRGSVRCGALLAALLLGACAGVPPEGAVVVVPRSAPTTFTLEGRLALGDEGRAAHVGLYWVSAADDEQLEFLSPLGQILARVRWQRGAPPVMTLPDGQHVAGAELESLMQQELGVQLPLERLRGWLLAVPQTGTRVLQVDAAGRPRRISEDGWIVEYETYMDDGAASLPRVLQGSSGSRRFRLVVASWELPR